MAILCAPPRHTVNGCLAVSISSSDCYGRFARRAADGGAAWVWRIRSIAPLHCGRGQGCEACGDELLVQADRLVGGSDAVLVIDDTAIPKEGTQSVGVAAQYASALGKTANCQPLVWLTLARGEVPVVLALREFLPESWTCKRSGGDRSCHRSRCQLWAAS